MKTQVGIGCIVGGWWGVQRHKVVGGGVESW